MTFITDCVWGFLLWILPWGVDLDKMEPINKVYTAFFVLIGMGVASCVCFLYLMRISQVKKVHKVLLKEYQSDQDGVLYWEEFYFVPKWFSPAFHTFFSAWKSAAAENSKAAFPVRLDDFMSTRQVLEGGAWHRLATALPGMYVSLGIFGTFLGVITGISDINAGDKLGLSHEIFTLISGLKIAFLTSLIGIFFSVGFTFVHRFLLTILEKRYAELVRVCGQTVFPYKEEEVSSLQLMQDIREGKESLRTIATDMAGEIANLMRDQMGPAIGEALSGSLLPILEKMTDDAQSHNGAVSDAIRKNMDGIGEAVKNHIVNAGNEQANILKEVLETYTKKLNEEFGEIFTKMGEVVQETLLVQKEIHKDMRDLGGLMAAQYETQKELIASSTHAAEAMDGMLDRFGTISTTIESAATAFATTGQVVEEAGDKTRAIYATISEVAEATVQSVAVLQDRLQETYGGMEKGAKAFAEQWENLFQNQLTRMTEELEDSMRAIQEGISQSAGTISNTWKEIQGHTTTIVETLETTTTNFREGVTDSLNGGLETFDSKVGDVVAHFSGTLHETRQAIQVLPSATEKILNGISGMQKELTRQKEVLAQLTNLGENTLAPNIKEYLTATETLAGATRDASVTYDQLSKWIAEQNQPVAEIKAKMDAETDADVRKWHAALEATQETFSQNLKASVAPAVTAIQSLKPEVQQMTRQIENLIVQQQTITQTSGNPVSRFFSGGRGA